MKDKHYSKMTLETKNIYRSYLKEKSKRGKIELKDLLSASLTENVNISDYIADEKYNSKALLYISLIAIISFILSYYLSQFLTSYRWLGFLILFILLVK